MLRIGDQLSCGENGQGDAAGRRRHILRTEIGLREAMIIDGDPEGDPAVIRRKRRDQHAAAFPFQIQRRNALNVADRRLIGRRARPLGAILCSCRSSDHRKQRGLANQFHCQHPHVQAETREQCFRTS